MNSTATLGGSEFFGWLGEVLMVIYYISPALPFFHLFQKKITYEYTPGVVVLANYCTSFTWIMYGYLINNVRIKMFNIFACAISTILLIIYLIHEVKQYLIDSILNALLIISGSLCARRFFLAYSYDEEFIKKICFGSSILLSLLPLILIYKVYQEKNYSIIPIFSVITLLLASFYWILFGLMTDEYYYSIVYFVVVVFCGLQFAVWKTYKMKYQGIHFTPSIEIDVNNTETEETKKIKEVQTKDDNENEKENPEEKKEDVKIPVKIESSSKSDEK